MHKIWLIIKREYKTRVKKKSFLLLTILVPVIIIGFYAAIIAIAVNAGSEKETIAVIDNTNLFEGNKQPAGSVNFVYIQGETENSFKTKYKNQGYKYFLSLPATSDSQQHPVLYYAKSLGPATQGKIEEIIKGYVINKRLSKEHIPTQRIDSIRSYNVEMATFKGEGDNAKSLASVNSTVGFTAGFLIYLMLFIYGSMVMRGVMEEKTSRIAEVIISSAKPFQLMLGKIIGIGAVGLTQFLIWVFLVIGLSYLIPVISPEFGHQIDAARSAAGPQGGGMVGVIYALKSLPIGNILFSFIFYFIGGYMMYAALFAAVGSMVNEDPQEAQQLVFPITMPIILSFVIMTQAINQPDSKLAIFGSLFPLTSPIVMMGRISYGVPLWQMLVSMALLVIGFLGTTWVAAKIYRTGILMYGKKPRLKEMIRWAFRKS